MLTFLRKSSSVSSFLLPASGLHSVIAVSVCTTGFVYLLCWPRGRGIGLVCTRRFSFHEFYNFLLFIFLILIFFGRLFFYPRHLPTPTPTTHDPRPTTHDPRPLPTTHDPRHLATLDGTTTARYWARACAISNKWWCHVRLKLPSPRKRLYLKFPIYSTPAENLPLVFLQTPSRLTYT